MRTAPPTVPGIPDKNSAPARLFSAHLLESLLTE